MASGDRSRTWFPEMVDRLRRSWADDLGIGDLISLAAGLDQQLHAIRKSRDIKPPIILCRKCGKRGPAKDTRVSVRATILAARRFGIIGPDDASRLERLWKRHRAQCNLDLYGAPAQQVEG